MLPLILLAQLTLAQSGPPATPLPAPTPQVPFLKTIVIVKSRPLCASLSDFVLPDGFIAGRDDDAFVATETGS